MASSAFLQLGSTMTTTTTPILRAGTMMASSCTSPLVLITISRSISRIRTSLLAKAASRPFSSPALINHQISTRRHPSSYHITGTAPNHFRQQQQQKQQQCRYLLTNSFAPFFEPPHSRTDLPPTTWRPPSESALWERPVLIIGAGVIGRRVALIWASDSRPVTLYDISDDALKSATEYLTDHLGAYCAERGTHPGHVCTTSNLRVATTTTTGAHAASSLVRSEAEEIEIDELDSSSGGSKGGGGGPWLAIECVPESLELKVDVLSAVERLLPGDCVLASNSSSLSTAEMAPRLRHPERLLNSHYFIPPRNRMVELMSSTRTHEAIFPFLEAQMSRVGLVPMTVPKNVQSPGFIMNRVWAACKRETLAVLAEGVAKPADVDALWRDFFHAEKGPCERMDEVGLDTVAMVERHILERNPEVGKIKVVEWLENNYVKKDKLGEKRGAGLNGTGDGLYTKEERERLKDMHRARKIAEVEETQGA